MLILHLLICFYFLFIYIYSKPKSLSQSIIQSFELEKNKGQIFSIDYLTTDKRLFIHWYSFTGNAILYEMKCNYDNYLETSYINKKDLAFGLANNTLFQVLEQQRNYILEYEISESMKNETWYILSFCHTDDCNFHLFWNSWYTPVIWQEYLEIIDEIDELDWGGKTYSIDVKKDVYFNIEINVILGSALLKVDLNEGNVTKEISVNNTNYVFAYNSIYFYYYGTDNSNATISITCEGTSVALYSIIYYFSESPWERTYTVAPGQTFTTFLWNGKNQTFYWLFFNEYTNNDVTSPYSVTIGSENCWLTCPELLLDKKEYYNKIINQVSDSHIEITIAGTDILSREGYQTMCSIYIYITSSNDSNKLFIIENLRTPLNLYSNTPKTLFFPIYYTGLFDSSLIVNFEWLLNTAFVIETRFNNQSHNSIWIYSITHSQSLEFIDEIRKHCNYFKLCYLIMTIYWPTSQLKDVSTAFFAVQMTHSKLHLKYLQKNKVYSTIMYTPNVYNHYYTDVKYGETGVVSLTSEQNHLTISAEVHQNNLRYNEDIFFYNSHLCLPLIFGSLKILNHENVWRYNITNEECIWNRCELYLSVVNSAFKDYDISFGYNMFIKQDNHSVEIFEHIFIQDEFSHDGEEFVYRLKFTDNYDAFILTIEGNVYQYKITGASTAFDFKNDYEEINCFEVEQFQFNKKDKAVSLLGEVIEIYIKNNKEKRYYNNFLIRVTPLYDREYNVIEINSDKVEYCYPDWNNACFYLTKYRTRNELFYTSIHSYYPNKSHQNIIISSVILQDKAFVGIKYFIDEDEFSFTNMDYPLAIWKINKSAIKQNPPFTGYIWTKIQAESKEHIIPVYISFSWVDNYYTLKPNTKVMYSIPNGSEVAFDLSEKMNQSTDKDTSSDFKIYTTITKVFGSGKFSTFEWDTNFMKSIDNLVISQHKYNQEQKEFTLKAEEEGWVVLISTQRRNIAQYMDIKEIMFSRRSEIMYTVYSFPIMLYMEIPEDIKNSFTINLKYVQKYFSPNEVLMNWNAFNITASFVEFNYIRNLIYNETRQVWPKVPWDSHILELEKLIIFISTNDTRTKKYKYVWIEINTTENYDPTIIDLNINNTGFQIISYPNVNFNSSSFPQWKYFYTYFDINSDKISFIWTKNNFMESVFKIEFQSCEDSMFDIEFLNNYPNDISNDNRFGKKVFSLTEITSRSIVMTIQFNNKIYWKELKQKIFFVVKYTTAEAEDLIQYNWSDSSFIVNYNEQHIITAYWSGIEESRGKKYDIEAIYYYRIYNNTIFSRETICIINYTEYRFNTRNKAWEIHYDQPDDVNRFDFVGTLVAFFMESSNEEIMIAYKPKIISYEMKYFYLWAIWVFLYIFFFVVYLIYSIVSFDFRKQEKVKDLNKLVQLMNESFFLDDTE